MQYTASILTTRSDREIDSFSVAVFPSRGQAALAITEAVEQHCDEIDIPHKSVRHEHSSTTTTWTVEYGYGDGFAHPQWIGHIKPTEVGEWICNP